MVHRLVRCGRPCTAISSAGERVQENRTSLIVYQATLAVNVCTTHSAHSYSVLLVCAKICSVGSLSYPTSFELDIAVQHYQKREAYLPPNLISIGAWLDCPACRLEPSIFVLHLHMHCNRRPFLVLCVPSISERRWLIALGL
jgi:hypothetical protein